MIIGTAGHIDHGKTTLVRALTGVDTDRLPEEKKRGISIELGYAFLDVPGQTQRLGFIDVPGHERLVHTMISGASGIDMALLLVAADDGPMPQTREHLAVLTLLDLRRGVVVITKADRADESRLLTVKAEVQQMLAASSLADAPILMVSAATGQGIPELREQLFEAARALQSDNRQQAAFRLAIDRVFTLDGQGTVVTGTVHAGRVTVGEELSLQPGGKTTRVRSLHAQNQTVTQALAGQRCAVGLAGMDRHDVERGQWLVAPQATSVSDRLDVELMCWVGEERPLRSGQPVHVHLGSATTMGSLAVLDKIALLPGERGLAQLVLKTPLGAWHGDRVVLRDAAASRTIAGGRVLDPMGPSRYRRTPQRLAELHILALNDPVARLGELLAVSPHGLDLQRYAAAQGRSLPPLPAGTLHHDDSQGQWALGAAPSRAARTRALEVLSGFHARYPEELGPDSARLRRLALPRLPEALWRALLSTLHTEGLVAQRGAYVHLPEHGVRLSVTEERIAQRVAPLLDRAGFEGAWVRDLARDTGEPEMVMRMTLARLAQRGELHQVVKDLYYPIKTMARLTGIANAVAQAQSGVVTAASFRDATATGPQTCDPDPRTL